MPEQHGSAYDTTAAQLTAAMLRFDIERLARNPIGLPYDDPGRLGEVAFVFMPRRELVADGELVRHLEAMPKPVLLAAMAQKGLIATWSPSGLDERGLAVFNHVMANQLEWVTKFLVDHSLADDDSVLLETTTETLVFPAGALRRWGEAYGAHIGWTLSELVGDPRARVRLNLIRGDGGRTPGWTCALPE